MDAQSADGPCTGTASHLICTVSTLAEDRAVTAAQKVLAEAQFQFKVAKDRLRKDESLSPATTLTTMPPPIETTATIDQA